MLLKERTANNPASGDTRARAVAALVFGYHARLPPLTAPAKAVVARPTPARRAPRPAVPVVLAPESAAEGSSSPAIEAIKWAIMLAAMAAPWILLLTGCR
jgi:hypothetical protein